MKARALLSGMLLAASLASTGCWSTTVRSGLPSGTTPAGWDDRWHSSLFFGSVELSGPYDLQQICPQGWSAIRTKTGVLNGLLILSTFDTYSTQTIKVTCAATGSSGAHIASAGPRAR